jgi:ADP-ribose pyrophosphatase
MPDPAPSDDERRWEVVGDDEVIHEGWISVSRRTYRLPDGRTAAWEMVGRAGGQAVSVLALTPDQRLVCVRQFRPGHERVVLGLPGGFVDRGETPEQAAARELAEETGYVGRDLQRVVSLRTTSALGERHVVIARDCRRETEQRLDEYEDCEPVVLEVAEVRAELRAGRMTATDLTYLGLDHLGLL